MPGQIIPGLTTTTITDRRHRIYAQPFVPGEDVILESANVDAGSAPTSLIRPGNVIALRGGTGQYVEANDANGDRNTPATVTALVTGAAAHQNAVLTFQVNGGPAFTVTLGGADNTDALIATALNANARFAGELIADVLAARVRVRTLRAGADQTITASDNVAGANTLFGAAATPSRNIGADADYRVTEEFTSLLDQNGAAAAQPVKTSMTAYYDVSELINLTDEARAVLTRRGSLFG